MDNLDLEKETLHLSQDKLLGSLCQIKGRTKLKKTKNKQGLGMMMCKYRRMCKDIYIIKNCIHAWDF